MTTVMTRPHGGLPAAVTLSSDLHDLERVPVLADHSAMIVLGVDHVHAIRESLGHEAAAELMAAVANRLRAAVAVEDTVALVPEVGFAVLRACTSDRVAAAGRARRLIEAVAAPIVIDDQELFVSASAGVAFAGPDASASSLMHDASAALRRAQRDDRGRIAVFEPQMRTEALDRLRMESDLHRGIDGGELRVAYQPLVSVSDRTVVGVEALVRWAHPVRGLIAPARFLPIAAQSGLITQIGSWVQREACAQAASWAASLPGRDPLAMTVNVSTRQLADPGFVTFVAETLAATGVAPRQLVLDITEGALRDDPAVLEALHELKALGVQLYLDDFVTGNAALSWLTRFPLDGLKLEAPFVNGLGDDPKNRSLLHAVCGMAAAFELEVVAEGVETEAQAAILEEAGCTVAQGYLFARPVPAGQLAGMLDARVPHATDATATEAPAPPATVTMREAAGALGISASTVRRWGEQGRLTALRTSGGHRRFLADEVRRLCAAERRRSGPVVRVVQPPDDPLPRVAALLVEHGMSIISTGLRGTYAANRTGWFGDAGGREHVQRWLRSLCVTLEAGNHAEALEATATLMRHARLSGTTTLERVTFLDRACATLLRMIDETEKARADLPAARRICAAMRQRALALNDE
jgi:diguanylate cyclase (GGDEF)-like protein/excisionase family DNA binding protein